ncbi:MAG: membrane dipeptidase [Bacteroidia bacterium]
MHSTLKPFLLSAVDTPWEDYDVASKEERITRSPRLTRADFTKLLDSGTKIITLALHPIERYLMVKVSSRPVLFALIFRMRIERMRQMLQKNPFLMLRQELRLLHAYLTNPIENQRALLIRAPHDLDRAVQDPQTLGIILSIEGAHSLGFEYRGYRFPKIKNFTYDPPEQPSLELIRKRLDWAASVGVWMITLVHMCYNGLATPARATELTGIKKILHDPIRTLKNMGSYRGLTAYGALFVQEAYKRDILIDIKHCDSESRQQIYEIAHMYQKPVIASHVGVSGLPHARGGRDHPRLRLQSETFNPWDINLHDTDILAIQRLGGLIGLILDERVLAGEKLLEKVRRGIVSWDYVIFQHILHIYEVLRAAQVPPLAALRVICIGSDFDGFIDPIDTVPTVREYPTALKPGLIQQFELHYDIFRETQKTPAEMADMILWENGYHFWRSYLTNVKERTLTSTV